MVKLSYLHEAVGAYLKLRGDKELLSVATYNGSAPEAFALHLCDIYDGPIGNNSFTGKDSIKLYKDGSTGRPEAPSEKKEPAITITDAKGISEDVRKACRCEKEMLLQSAQADKVKLSIYYGSLDLLCRMGMISRNDMKKAFAEFTIQLFGLNL